MDARLRASDDFKIRMKGGRSGGQLALTRVSQPPMQQASRGVHETMESRRDRPCLRCDDFTQVPERLRVNATTNPLLFRDPNQLLGRCRASDARETLGILLAGDFLALVEWRNQGGGHCRCRGVPYETKRKDYPKTQMHFRPMITMPFPKINPIVRWFTGKPHSEARTSKDFPGSASALLPRFLFSAYR